jgi:hypothetical protein
MTTDQFKSALSELGIGQRAFAAFIGVHPDTGKRWAQRGPPPPVQKWIRYLLATKQTPAEINADIRDAA